MSGTVEPKSNRTEHWAKAVKCETDGILRQTILSVDPSVRQYRNRNRFCVHTAWGNSSSNAGCKRTLLPFHGISVPCDRLYSSVDPSVRHLHRTEIEPIEPIFTATWPGHWASMQGNSSTSTQAGSMTKRTLRNRSNRFYPFHGRQFQMLVRTPPSTECPSRQTIPIG